VADAAKGVGSAVVIEGGWRCGAVSYTLPFEEMPQVYCCHCDERKKQLASAFSISAGINVARLSISGELRTVEG
jgi:hypothetical protein